MIAHAVVAHAMELSQRIAIGVFLCCIFFMVCLLVYAAISSSYVANQDDEETHSDDF